MPEHALYYPEWTINDPAFLAESLLYWDRLACIVPFDDFREVPWHEDAEIRNFMAEAHERFVFPLVPMEEQKARAHERIKAFAELEPPPWCRPENLTPHHRQIFSAYKFAPETVELLRERGWTSVYPQPNNLELQLIADAAADLVIGALADECSSPTMPPVTDDPGAFAANCNLLLRELGSSTGITTKAGGAQQSAIPAESDYAFLMAKIPHLGVQPDQLDPGMLRRILRARDDPEIDQRRQAFQKKVDDYLETLRTAQGPERGLVAGEFGHELQADLELLKRELRRAGLEAIFSKESFVSVVVGLLTGIIRPELGLAIGLAGELLTYRRKRQEVCDNHWSSWIFSTQPHHLSLWW